MKISEDPFFLALFNTDIPRVILKADNPHFTIIAYNDAYKVATYTGARDVRGLSIWEAFKPETDSGEGPVIVLNALLTAMETRAVVKTPPFQYDIPSANPTGTTLSYWQLEIIPVPGSQAAGNQAAEEKPAGEKPAQEKPAGEKPAEAKPTIEYLITTTLNITDEVLKHQSLEEAQIREQDLKEEIAVINEELSSSNEELRFANEYLIQFQRNLQSLNLNLEQRVAERTKELSDSEALLRSVFEQSPLALCVLSGPELIIELANDNILKLWNKTREVIGRRHAEVRSDPETAPFLKIMDRVYTTGIPYTGHEERAFTAHGNTHEWGYFNFTYQCIRNVEGMIIGILAVVEDVTDKVLSGIKADRINMQLGLAIEAAQMGSWHIQHDTRALKYNSVLAKIFGYEGTEDMTYEQAIAQVTDEYRDKIRKEIDKAIAAGGDYDITYSQRRFNDGEIIWLRSLGKIRQDEEGNYTVFSGVVMDITAQETGHRQLEAKQHQLNTVIKTAPIGMAVITGKELTIDLANQQMLDIWHRDQKAIEGKTLLQVFPELKDQPFPQLLLNVFESGKRLEVAEMEVDISTPLGLDRRCVNFSYDPLLDINGLVESILVTVIDITEIIQSRRLLLQGQEELQALNEELVATNEELYQTQQDLVTKMETIAESEARWRYLLEDAPVAIAVMKGRELTVEAANTRVLEIWDKTDAIIGKPLHLALPELAGQQFLQWLDEVYATGVPFVGNEVGAQLLRKGIKEDVYSNFVYHPIKGPDGQVNSIMLVATIVTEQVNARKELEGAYDRVRLAKEAAQLGTFDMDLEAGTLDWDDRCRQLFGISHHGIVTYEKDFLENLHPDDRDRVMKVIGEVFNRFINNGDYDVEYRTVGAEDHKIRWVRAKGKAYFDKSDKPIRFIGSVLDITEQKRDELRKNDFIHMVSHELKTPLTSIKGYIQLLQDGAKEDSFETNALQRVDTNVTRMVNLVNSFLNISRLESGKLSFTRQHFNLDELIREVIEESKLTTVSHEIHFEPCTPENVFADREKIGSVISNLISNAIKYSPEGKMISVACHILGDTAQVSIRDEGIGIQSKDLEYVFDRYYRVESQSTALVSGFGIGLYLSSEIIKLHHGHIWAESTPARGSTFYFTIPVNGGT